MDSPAVSESVNRSNNIWRAEELDNYAKGVQDWQPSPIKHGLDNTWRSIWSRKDAGCSPSTAFNTDPLPKSGTQKIKDAIQSIKFKDPCVLVQFWAPDQPAGRGCLLTTSNQPFVFTEINDELGSFRIASLKEEFYVNLEKEVGIGLIGRVFLKGSPEWTPNVQYCSRKEYPQLDDEAVHCNVRGTLALPVFSDNRRCCLGVLEIVTTVEKECFDCEFKEICRALEGVNLNSSEKFPCPTKKVGRKSKAKVKSGVDVVQAKKIRKTKTYGITKEDLSRHFDKPRAVAAAEFKIKKSSLRNLCKRLGIPKWPYKKRSRGSCILGKYEKETLGLTELDTRSMEDLSTLTSEDDYGAGITDDQYPVEVFEPTSLDLDMDHMVNAAATDEVIETSSLVEPYATLAAREDLIHVSNEEEYRADQNMDELSDSEFFALFDFLKEAPI